MPPAMAELLIFKHAGMTREEIGRMVCTDGDSVRAVAEARMEFMVELLNKALEGIENDEGFAVIGRIAALIHVLVLDRIL